MITETVLLEFEIYAYCARADPSGRRALARRARPAMMTGRKDKAGSKDLARRRISVKTTRTPQALQRRREHRGMAPLQRKRPPPQGTRVKKFVTGIENAEPVLILESVSGDSEQSRKARKKPPQLLTLLALKRSTPSKIPVSIGTNARMLRKEIKSLT